MSLPDPHRSSARSSRRLPPVPPRSSGVRRVNELKQTIDALAETLDDRLATLAAELRAENDSRTDEIAARLRAQSEELAASIAISRVDDLNEMRRTPRRRQACQRRASRETRRARWQFAPPTSKRPRPHKRRRPTQQPRRPESSTPSAPSSRRLRPSRRSRAGRERQRAEADDRRDRRATTERRASRSRASVRPTPKRPRRQPPSSANASTS